MKTNNSNRSISGSSGKTTPGEFVYQWVQEQNKQTEKKSQEDSEAYDRAVQENRACGVTALGYIDTGSIKLAGCNEMNIPVNCFIYPPDEESKKWRWFALNYMPRKEYASGMQCGPGGDYQIEADSLEVIKAAVNKYVVPLYEVATHNLKTQGKNYYWEKSEVAAAK